VLEFGYRQLLDVMLLVAHQFGDLRSQRANAPIQLGDAGCELLEWAGLFALCLRQRRIALAGLAHSTSSSRIRFLASHRPLRDILRQPPGQRARCAPVTLAPVCSWGDRPKDPAARGRAPGAAQLLLLGVGERIHVRVCFGPGQLARQVVAASLERVSPAALARPRTCGTRSAKAWRRVVSMSP